MFRGEFGFCKERLLIMGGLTEKCLTNALRAYAERDDALAELVKKEDSEIDDMEVEMDDLVINLMGIHGSRASSGRLMLATSKISGYLERIGDQAVTIARRTLKLNVEPELHETRELTKMGRAVVSMIQESLEAFTQMDIDRAAYVIARDKEIDSMNKIYERRLTAMIKKNPEILPTSLHALLIARCIERSGDGAKAIAQEVYFLYTARDIRHSSRPSES